MFTGIIESLGIVESLLHDKGNVHIDIQSPVSNQLKVDQSVSHNGICLTVVAVNNNMHTVTAIAETLNKTNIGSWQKGTRVNLERCLKADGRFDGHIVQGHVDTVATCIAVEDTHGSWKYTFNYKNDAFTVEKGSVCVNGVSLTVVDSKPDEFSVAIIPYTYQHTNFGQLKAGDKVNLEFDIVGKYITRLFQLYRPQNP